MFIEVTIEGDKHILINVAGIDRILTDGESTIIKLRNGHHLPVKQSYGEVRDRIFGAKP